MSTEFLIYSMQTYFHISVIKIWTWNLTVKEGIIIAAERGKIYLSFHLLMYLYFWSEKGVCVPVCLNFPSSLLIWAHTLFLFLLSFSFSVKSFSYLLFSPILFLLSYPFTYPFSFLLLFFFHLPFLLSFLITAAAERGHFVYLCIFLCRELQV